MDIFAPIITVRTFSTTLLLHSIRDTRRGRKSSSSYDQEITGSEDEGWTRSPNVLFKGRRRRNG